MYGSPSSSEPPPPPPPPQAALLPTPDLSDSTPMVSISQTKHRRYLTVQYLGAVSISRSDCPRRWRTIVPCFYIAEWSVARSDSPSCLLKQPPGVFWQRWFVITGRLMHQGPVHKQSQVNYSELELQFKSISSNFIGWICLQAQSYLAWLCLWTGPRCPSRWRHDQSRQTIMGPSWCVSLHRIDTLYFASSIIEGIKPWDRRRS